MIRNTRERKRLMLKANSKIKDKNIDPRHNELYENAKITHIKKTYGEVNRNLQKAKNKLYS